MRKLEDLLNKQNVALQPVAKEKLARTQAGDTVLLKDKEPTKAYLIIKLALVDLSDKLNNGKKGQLFGETTAADKDNFAADIKKKVQAKINEKKNLTESFGITDNSLSTIAKGVHKGIIRELVETMYPFTIKINAVKNPLQKQSYKQTYECLCESLICEIRRIGVFNVN